MKVGKIAKKTVAVAAAMCIIAISFTSCQREGCPGQITKAKVEKTSNC